MRLASSAIPGALVSLLLPATALAEVPSAPAASTAQTPALCVRPGNQQHKDLQGLYFLALRPAGRACDDSATQYVLVQRVALEDFAVYLADAQRVREQTLHPRRVLLSKDSPTPLGDTARARTFAGRVCFIGVRTHDVSPGTWEVDIRYCMAEGPVPSPELLHPYRFDQPGFTLIYSTSYPVRFIKQRMSGGVLD